MFNTWNSLILLLTRIVCGINNGGQAYIKLSNDSNVLMIIDHVNVNNPTIELCDGTQYFEDCKGYNFVHSRRIRQLDKTMVDWFITNFPEKAVL